jgi:hypothetical protein
MRKIYSWESIYKAAIDESDPAKRPTVVLKAEETVWERICALELTATRHSINELAYLEKAVEGLAKLRRLPDETPIQGSDKPKLPENSSRARAKSTGV